MHEIEAEAPTIKYFVIEEYQTGGRCFSRAVKIPIGSEPPYAEAFLIDGLEMSNKQIWFAFREYAHDSLR